MALAPPFRGRQSARVPPHSHALFIGHSTSATAAWGGKMVTNLPLSHCSRTGSQALFWPCSTNLTSFLGFMFLLREILVAASARRILSSLVPCGRLHATVRPSRA